MRVFNNLINLDNFKKQIKDFISLLDIKISNLRKKIFDKKVYHDNNRLFFSTKKITPNNKAWLLNSALISSAYERADSDTRKQLDFIESNYLAKSAPIDINDPLLNAKNFNTRPIAEDGYHRSNISKSVAQSILINKNKLALAKESSFYLTDTTDITHLYPLKFTYINDQLDFSQRVDLLIKEAKNFIHNRKTKPFLFDITNDVKETIITNGNKNKEKEFKKQYKQAWESINKIQNAAILKLQKEYPKLTKTQLSHFFNSNQVVISRVNLDDLNGIKYFPQYYGILGIDFAFNYLKQFISQTGINLGGVNSRKIHQSIFKNTYSVQGKRDTLYFRTKQDIIETSLFARLEKKWDAIPYMEQKPHLAILGSATLKLIKGWVEEITDEKWEELNQNLAIREVVQASLFKIHENLSMAELYQDNFTKFANLVELIHQEIAVLLEFSKPFTPQDFSKIYSQELKTASDAGICTIPEGLHQCVKAGLGKTAVNVFAGINAAVQHNNSCPVRCLGNGVYEEGDLFNSANKLEKILKDSNIKKVDFLAAQFNPNIEIDREHSHYKVDDISGNIKKIFTEKPETDHLTVSVDCTIDYMKSPKVQALLREFETEIKEGKLNFIFFRSGQKFDMLGMDNYYGAPFYIVNNNSEVWKPFDILFHESHQTDLLSMQWFSLANRCIADLIDKYRHTIFTNTRKILDLCPNELHKKPKQSSLWVCTAEQNMEASFIDIKVDDFLKSTIPILNNFYKVFLKNGIPVYNRSSFGFIHPNINVINSSVRINPGLNPDEIPVMVQFLKMLK